MSAPQATGSTWAVIAGGGTGGHVVPALAIAEALAARGRDRSSIHLVGSRRGLEAHMVPAAGFGVTLLPGRGLPRRLSLTNVASAVALAWATVLALALLLRRRPAVVVSVGGYASVPATVAAAVLRIPVVVHEQNRVPGAANRLAARFAARCAVTFEGTPLPNAVLTGLPLRRELLELDRSEPARTRARRELGLPTDRTVLLVTGGSLGARRVNDAVLGLAARWKDRADVAIHHVVGRRDWPELSGRDVPDGALVYRRIEFEDRMALALGAADLAVTRAGANTVAELAVAGVPAVLVPLPIATEDHQTANARTVAEAGAGVLVPDAECTVERLAAELEPLLDDPERRDAMAAAAVARSRTDAAERVADLVEAVARG